MNNSPSNSYIHTNHNYFKYFNNTVTTMIYVIIDYQLALNGLVVDCSVQVSIGQASVVKILTPPQNLIHWIEIFNQSMD